MVLAVEQMIMCEPCDRSKLVEECVSGQFEEEGWIETHNFSTSDIAMNNRKAKTATDLLPIGPRSSPPRVLPDLSPQEDRHPCLWWFPLRWLRQGPHRPCFPDRGAEDRQEGSQGVSGEGRWQALNGCIICSVFFFSGSEYGKIKLAGCRSLRLK